MAGNRVLLPLVQSEHPGGPARGMGAMNERVHMPYPFPAGVAVHIPLVPVALPVVAEKVVEQRRPCQGADPLLPQPKAPGQPVGAFSGVNRVDV